MFAAATLCGCAPTVLERGPAAVLPALTDDYFIADDGAPLRLRTWLPEGRPWAVVIAVHGFGDRSKAFEEAGEAWRTRGIAVYAYDQRGFAQSPGRGRWPGSDNLAVDLTQLARLTRTRHPATPVYLLGESMGGAVVLAALARPDHPPVDGVVLVAPAAVSAERLPALWTGPLWLLAHTIPWYPASGEGLGLRPTDNLEAWRRMSRDPDIVREPRMDVLYGLTRLMDRAARAAPALPVPALVLYGGKDVIVKPWMFADLRARLPAQRITLRTFDDGHHWLLRDLGADVVRDTVAGWLRTQSAARP